MQVSNAPTTSRPEKTMMAPACRSNRPDSSPHLTCSMSLKPAVSFLFGCHLEGEDGSLAFSSMGVPLDLDLQWQQHLSASSRACWGSMLALQCACDWLALGTTWPRC